jgi:hypothetical protein
VGLRTAFLPMVVYAFRGTSHMLSVNTTAERGLTLTRAVRDAPDAQAGRLLVASSLSEVAAAGAFAQEVAPGGHRESRPAGPDRGKLDSHV